MDSNNQEGNSGRAFNEKYNTNCAIQNNIPFKIFYLSKYNLINLLKIIKTILNSKIHLNRRAHV